MGFLINSVASLLVAITYYIFTSKMLFAIILFVALSFLNIIGEKFKLLIDLRNPQMDWTSEYTMMKQNTNVMYELFYTVFVAIILIGISQIIDSFEIYLITCLILLVFIDKVLTRFIRENQSRLFEKIF